MDPVEGRQGPGPGSEGAREGPSHYEAIVVKTVLAMAHNRNEFDHRALHSSRKQRQGHDPILSEALAMLQPLHADDADADTGTVLARILQLLKLARKTASIGVMRPSATLLHIPD